jgi:5-methylcytosine-specific restriction endonuclease McrA
MLDALALNLAGIPMDIISWRKAVTLWALGRAEILASYEDRFIHSPRLTLAMPSVVQCLDVRSMPRNFTHVLPLTRRNLYGRDGGLCVYCGQKISLSSFTIDHVIPRSQGGKTSWDNVVTACMHCNNRKGNRRPRPGEIDMLHEPFVPRLTHAAPRNLVEKLSFRAPPMAWSTYIYWSVALPPKPHANPVRAGHHGGHAPTHRLSYDSPVI